jgi:hypothetical protein
MSSYRVLGLCLAAALLLVGATASNAQAAAPEFRQHGLLLAKTVGFTFKGGFGQTSLGTKKWSWSGVSGGGTIEGPNKIVNAEIVFTGSKIGACTVHSPGAPAGSVVVTLVEGRIGYLEEATKNVGLLLSKTAAVFTEIAEAAGCNKAITLTGNAIGKITPVNSETTKLFASFLVAGGKDQFTKFEGEGEEHVLHYKEAGGPEGESTFECENEELVANEAVEVKG